MQYVNTMLVNQERFLLVLFYIIPVPVHVADLVQRDQMPVKSAEGKIVESLLIIHFSIPAIVVTIPQVLLCLSVSIFRRHVVKLHGFTKTLLKATSTAIIMRTQIIHGVMVSFRNLDLIQRCDVFDHKWRQILWLVTLHQIGRDNEGRVLVKP